MQITILRLNSGVSRDFAFGLKKSDGGSPNVVFHSCALSWREKNTSRARIFVQTRCYNKFLMLQHKEILWKDKLVVFTDYKMLKCAFKVENNIWMIFMLLREWVCRWLTLKIYAKAERCACRVRAKLLFRNLDVLTLALLVNGLRDSTQLKVTSAYSYLLLRIS